MRKKTYKINVKLVFEIDIRHRQINKEKAKNDIKRLIQDYIENNLDITQIFDEEPYIIYRVEEIDDKR